MHSSRFFCLLLTLHLGLFVVPPAVGQDASAPWTTEALEGAWRGESDGHERVLLVQDGYWSYTLFSVARKEFVTTFGGTAVVEGQRVRGRIHFDASDPQRVGESFEVSLRRTGNELVVVQDNGTQEVWRRVDEGQGPLAGLWRITGREQNAEMQKLPFAARRTLKLLTGSRFQWFAINVQTGEFSGTGGGTYTFVDGQYTEQLEFFSRNSERVGAQLRFTGEVRDGEWHHRGLSSTGTPIYEVWSPLEPEGRE